MIKNAFTDIIFGWERMTTSQKVERLQALENMIARFQNRKARRIITKKNNKFVALLKQHGEKEPKIRQFRIVQRTDKGRGKSDADTVSGNKLPEKDT